MVLVLRAGAAPTMLSPLRQRQRHCGGGHQQQHRLQRRRVAVVPAAAAVQQQQQDQQQQQQPGQQPQQPQPLPPQPQVIAAVRRASPLAAPSPPPIEHHVATDEFDLSVWHYMPWWLQPPTVIASGLLFIAASLWLDDEPAAKTAALAGVPVAMFWGICLFVLPRRFRSFAVGYLERHPEAEAAALEEVAHRIEETLAEVLPPTSAASAAAAAASMSSVDGGDDGKEQA